MNEINLMTGLVSGIVLIIVSGLGISLFSTIKEIKSDIKELLAMQEKRIAALEKETKDISSSLVKMDYAIAFSKSDMESIKTSQFEIMKKTIDMSNAIVQKLRFISNADQ